MELFNIVGRISAQYSEAVSDIQSVSTAADNAAESMENLGDEAERTQEPVEGLGDETEETGEQTDDTNDSFTVWKGTLANLASEVIKNLIGKITDLATEIVGLGEDFTATMSEVQAISGASDEEFETLKETARKFGSTTVFSATEAAEALKYMSLAGWDVEESTSALGGVLDLAAASGLDLGTTSDIVTDALTAFGLKAKDSGHFADVLASASSNANTDVSMMGETFKYVAPIAGSLGYSIEDMAIAIGTMANNGIKGSQAGTSLRMAISNLISPSEQTADLMKSLGFYASETITTFDKQSIDDQMLKVEKASLAAEKAQTKYNTTVSKYGEDSAEAEAALSELSIKQQELANAEKKLDVIKSGEVKTIYSYNKAIQNEDGSMKSFRETLQFLRKSLQDKSEADKAAAVSTIFGTQSMSGMLALINTTDEDLESLTNSIDNCDGTTQQMAATMNDNLKGDLANMNSALEELKLKIFDGLEDPLRSAAQFITNRVVPALTALLQNFDSILPGIVALTAAIVTFKTVMAISSLINAVTTAWTAYKTANEGATVAQWLFNAAVGANPLVLLISLLVGLVALFVVLWNKCDWFREFWINAWEKIKEVASSVWEAITGFFSNAWENIKGVFSTIGEWFSEKFTSAYEEIKNAFSAAGTFFSELWENIKKPFVSVADWFKEKFKAAWEGVKNVFSTGGKIFEGIKEGITGVFTTVVNGIIKGINWIIKQPFDKINDVLGFMKGLDFWGWQPFGWFETFPVPEIPELAEGGILPKGKTGYLEGDGAEAVVPLERNTEWTGRVADLIVAHQQNTPQIDTTVLDKLTEIANLLKSDRQSENGMNLTINIENFNGNNLSDIDKLVEEIKRKLYPSVYRDKIVWE